MAMMANEPGVADMILLDPVTEDQLLKNLEIRFKQSKIYVSDRFRHFLLFIINSCLCQKFYSEMYTQKLHV